MSRIINNLKFLPIEGFEIGKLIIDTFGSIDDTVFLICSLCCNLLNNEVLPELLDPRIRKVG